MKTPYISFTSVVCARDFIHDSGGDVDALFGEVGLDHDLKNADDEFCSFHKVLTLYEIAAQSLGKENFGLEMALTLPPDFVHFSPYVYMGHFEKNARSWLFSAMKFQSMFTNGHGSELIDDPETEQATIRMHTDVGLALPRQWREFQMAGNYLLVSELINTPDAVPKVVRMRHTKPNDTGLHHRIFGKNIEFGSEYDEFVFDRRLLDLKLKGRSRLLRPLIGLYVGRKLQDSPPLDLSLSGNVRLYLQCVMGMGKNSMEDAARAIGVSVKKLQRDLFEEGTSFSQILDQLRRRKALYLLRTPDLKVRQIAAMLDYSATAAFSLAFKRWTGMSPQAYREVVREKGEMLELQ